MKYRVMRTSEVLRIAAISAVLAFAAAWVCPAALALDASQTVKPGDTTPDEIFRSANKSFRQGDKTGAIKLLEEAAETGHPGALWVLGDHYRHGDGVPVDNLKAFQIFNEIANGHADDAPSSPQAPFVASAFVALGSYYLTGINDTAIKPNVEEAQRLLKYAASYFGDREAQFKLGQIYADPNSADRNPTEAARWLTLAARKGHPGAQALLGQLLFTGDTTVQRRPLLGLMWLTIARAHAGGPSDDWIREMQEEAFSVAAENDRRQAVKLSQEWIAKNQ